MKIFINPGHAPNGNPDPGACGEYSRECDIVASVGEIVANDLANVGYETYVLQSDSLGEICETSNEWGADVFVSIHCNAASSPYANGTETFYYEGSNNGMFLANCVQQQLLDTMGTTDRGLKTNSLYVVRNTDAVAILVELGFISNIEEENYLNQHIDEMAHAIARGITDYFA